MRSIDRYKGTPAWVPEAKRLWQTGLPMKEVARQVGKHWVSVTNYRSRDKWERPKTPRSGPKPKARPWIAEAQKMWEAGVFGRVIGERVGRAESTILAIAKQYNWQRPKGCTRCGNMEDIKDTPNPVCIGCKRARRIREAHKRKSLQITGRFVDDGTLTGPTLQSLFGKAKSCPYCGERMASRDKSLDHVWPRSKGGWHSITNAIVCCKRCNSKKLTHTPMGWLSRLSSDRQARVRKSWRLAGISPDQPHLVA